MLSKIILLNCANYQKAVISLDRESIQIVGRNNIGKTTLIGVLNFLYIQNPRDWNFIHSSKETLNFYFKNLDKSYILFEIYKNGYFCILLRRQEQKLLYYKIDSPYDEIESFFFQKREEKQVLLDFETIMTSLIGNIKKLEDREYRALLYGESKRDKSVLWLQKDVKQSTFVKIYRYLLNPSLIDNDVFKESLLVSDGKENSEITFVREDNQKIESMQKKLKEIERLKSTTQEFYNFKDMYVKFISTKNKLNKILCSFTYLYEQELQQIKSSKNKLDTRSESIINEVISPLIEEKEGVIGENAKTEFEIKNDKTSLGELLSKIEAIGKLDPIELLNVSKQNLEKDIWNREYSLSQIQKERYTLDSVEALMLREQKKIASLQAQINNFENLLIHHICENKDGIRIINSVLSDAVLKLDKSAIVKKINFTDENRVDLFDGTIDITLVEKKEPASIELLRTELQEAQEMLKKLGDIKQAIINYQAIEEEIEKKKCELSTINSNIQEIESIPNLKIEIQKKEALIQENQSKLASLQSRKSKIEVDIKDAYAQKEEIARKKNEIENRARTLEGYYNKIEELLMQIDINVSQIQTEQTVDDAFREIMELKEELKNIDSKKDEEFKRLKHTLYKEHSDEEAFIREVEEDLESMQDKEEAIDTLIESITNETSKPTASLLIELKHFESYIVSLNTQFKKYKISNLQSIEIKLQKNKKVLDDLEAIAKIDKGNLFNFDQHGNYLEILKEYISGAKKIKLFDLFDITFVVNGKERNLKHQIESNGTDIMLKSSLFMLIVGKTIIQDENNKLVIYLDELSSVDDDNVKGFIQRCAENNFIPIFASPDKKAHIQKYYDLLRLPQSGKIVVDEKRAIYATDRV